MLSELTVQYHRIQINASISTGSPSIMASTSYTTSED